MLGAPALVRLPPALTSVATDATDLKVKSKLQSLTTRSVTNVAASCVVDVAASCMLTYSAAAKHPKRRSYQTRSPEYTVAFCPQSLEQDEMRQCTRFVHTVGFSTCSLGQVLACTVLPSRQIIDFRALFLKIRCHLKTYCRCLFTFGIASLSPYRFLTTSSGVERMACTQHGKPLRESFVQGESHHHGASRQHQLLRSLVSRVRVRLTVSLRL